MKLSYRLRNVPLLASLLALSALLAACGGGGGGSANPPPPPLGYVDANTYSVAYGASLATPNEHQSVTHGHVLIDGVDVVYTATAGHLTISDDSGNALASMFYVAYTADGADAATRPLTFFFNGGPGSASAWLHLGSFGPKRLVTGVPALTQAAPFPYVDNAESLLDTTDLVFVDAIGTGLSEAIAPYSNGSFWGVDVDATAFRRFIARYTATAARAASPHYLFGESYGTVRASVLAHQMAVAGQPLAGVILQSSILDYYANCWNYLTPLVSCGGFLPSYAATGAFFNLVSPAPPDLPTFMSQMRDFTVATYEPAVANYLQAGTLPGNEVFSALVADTGLADGAWRARFNMDADHFRHQLRTGQVSGIYDGRMAAPTGSALAADDDPSNTFIEAPFTTAIKDVLDNQLLFTTPSGYPMFSGANARWVFAHNGSGMPDVVPDLAAALMLEPALRVLSLNGAHDLITPFHRTELDLARLGVDARISVRTYAGGHMTYLDDQSRPLEKADLRAFYATSPGAAP